MESSIAQAENREAFRIPTERAEAVILPSGYTDPEKMNAAFAWLRENQPLGLAEVDGFDPLWLVTKHADILAIERQSNLFRSMEANPILNTQAGDDFLKENCGGTTRVITTLTHMDAPEHAIYRQIASNYFMPGRIGKLDAQVREIAKAAVDRLGESGDELDFVKDFALFYPLRVVMSLFGVPPEDESKMLQLTQDYFGASDPESRRDDVEISPATSAQQIRQTIEDFYTYFDTFTDDRRQNPRDDLMTIIANAQVDGQPISKLHANGYYIAIATAGHDTTSSTTATIMKVLIERPDVLEQVRADPSLISNLIDEGLRWYTPVFHFMRTAAEDTELRGRPIRKGDRLMLCYPSANRDEEVFDRPFEFDIMRKPNRHMSFGNGPHMCIGQHLAKLEIKILLEELLPRIESAELTGAPRYVETNFVGGMKSMPVRLKIRKSS